MNILTPVYEARMVGERACTSWSAISRGVYENRLKWPRPYYEVRKRYPAFTWLRRLRCALTLAHWRDAYGAEVVADRVDPGPTRLAAVCKRCRKAYPL